MKNIIFLGAPGCGKGTQSAMLTEKLGFMHVSTGDLLRNIIQQKTEFADKLKQIMASGQYISDEVVNQLVDNFYAKVDEKANIVLDGYPRNVAQAKALDSILAKHNTEVNKVLYFDIAQSSLIKRVTGRYICKDCGAIYNSFLQPTKLEGKCDRCGGTDFNIRDDDTEEVVINRYKIFKETTDPLLDYYASKLIHLDAEEKAENISVRITNILDLKEVSKSLRGAF